MKDKQNDLLKCIINIPDKIILIDLLLVKFNSNVLISKT